MGADIVTAFTAATTTVLADYGDVLIAAAPVVLGIAVGSLLFRKARGLIRG